MPNITIPNLRAALKLNANTTKLDVADQVSSALHVRFGSDLIGWFEELDALVARTLYFIIGIYETQDSNERQINIELRSMIDKYSLRTNVADVKTELVNISQFLGVILRTKTQLVVYSLEGPNTPLESVEIPNLYVSLQTQSQLPLEQLSARIGATLGVTFGSIASNLDKGYYKNQPWYVQTANTLEHEINIYAATAHHILSAPRPIILEMQPKFQVEQLGLDYRRIAVRKHDISQYVASLLRNETDITFVH